MDTRTDWLLVALCAGLVCQPASAGDPPGVTVAVDQGRRYLVVDGDRVLELGFPWIASADWKPVRTFPAEPATEPATAPDGSRVARRPDRGPFGTWTETVTQSGDLVRFRYDFDFVDTPGAANIQWYWRLEPDRFAAAMLSGHGAQDLGVRPAAGANLDALRDLDLVLPDVGLTITCAAADATWKFQDVRAQDWAKCFRFEYNRAFAAGGKRSGWFEAAVGIRRLTDPWVPLTEGAEARVRGVRLAAGPPLAEVGKPLGTIVLWHTVSGAGARGTPAGEVSVLRTDGSTDMIALPWEEAVTAPDDDPRDLPGGVLVQTPDGKPAWLALWANPRPAVPVRAIVATVRTPGWRLLAASGLAADTDAVRAAALLAATQTGPLTETVVVSLDGIWTIEPAGGGAREIAVPAFWDQAEGMRAVHEATYRRAFAVPEACRGQRLALRFGAVGDAAEVFVNGIHVGGHTGPLLPFEVDISGVVPGPSSDNRLEVRVKDDSFFSVPRESSDWRNRKHWLPRGMGTNNRKGLYQGVSLVGQPAVRIADLRIQTSVRQRTLTVVCELFNGRRETVRARLGGSVRPLAGGAPVLTLPQQPVELPGYVTTTVTLQTAVPEAGVEWWQPDHPTLYALRGQLTTQDGDRLHSTEAPFGFREVWFEGVHFYLNGIRCNLRGESPAYGEKTGLFATRAAATEMVRRYQAANCNVLRFHASPAPPHVLDVCDELGMLVIDESAIYASWQMLMPEHPQFMANCVEHLARWVRRDRNHPAVVLWSGDNEGLNVNLLSAAQLAEFKRVIDAHDFTRPVIFDGDGTAYGVSPASVKHYVRTLDDLRERGGRSSGYARDLRHDIYWATEYRQDVPLGCGEFLFPYEPGLRDREREVVAMMGLQARGYRLADWFDIRPYNPSYGGFLKPEGTRPGYEEAYDLLVKSFAPVAVFDREYDALGPFPPPPVLPVGRPVTRTLIVYNDTFADDQVTVRWQALIGDRRVAGAETALTIPLGDHRTLDISFTPDTAGPLALELTSHKSSRETFRDVRRFTVE